MIIHGKEYSDAIRKTNFSRKYMLVLAKKARDTKRKYKTNGGKVEDDATVETLYISDNEVNMITGGSA